jgi:hypothetical protein
VGSGCSLSRVEARLRSATACIAMAVLDFGKRASAALSDRVICYGGFRFCITCATAPFNARSEIVLAKLAVAERSRSARATQRKV